jgi:hypothetical protein
LRPGKGGFLLNVRATPRASRDEVAGLVTAADGSVSLAVRVTAVPDKGKANKAVIETVARAARIAKSSISLASGETERNKTLLVAGDGKAIAAWIATLETAGKDD